MRRNNPVFDSDLDEEGWPHAYTINLIFIQFSVVMSIGEIEKDATTGFYYRCMRCEKDNCGDESRLIVEVTRKYIFTVIEL
jgi:hypothetical protein